MLLDKWGAVHPITMSPALSVHNKLREQCTIGYLGLFTVSAAPPIYITGRYLHLPVKMEIRGTKCTGWLAYAEDIIEAGLEK